MHESRPCTGYASMHRMQPWVRSSCCSQHNLDSCLTSPAASWRPATRASAPIVVAPIVPIASSLAASLVEAALANAAWTEAPAASEGVPPAANPKVHCCCAQQTAPPAAGARPVSGVNHKNYSTFRCSRLIWTACRMNLLMKALAGAMKGTGAQISW